jgi:hypothetical protein
VTSVRIALPSHLRTLAGVGAEVRVKVPDEPTIADAIDGLEAAHPPLRGTIRDRSTGERRPFMRYVACGTDISHEPPDHPLPDAVVRGDEVLRVVGAIAGG